MITIADLKQHLEQFADDAMVVLRADTGRELYDDTALIDIESDCIRMKALVWKGAQD